ANGPTRRSEYSINTECNAGAQQRKHFQPEAAVHLDMKQTGKPSAGNPHAGFDEAGTGNPLTVWLLRHSQRKRGATARLNLRSRAPVLDPTCVQRRLVHSAGSRPARVRVRTL